MDTETILRVFSEIKNPLVESDISDQNITYNSYDDTYRLKISSNSYILVLPERNISSNIKFYVNSYLQKNYFYTFEVSRNIDSSYKEYIQDPSFWILSHGKIKLPDIIKDEWIYQIAEFPKSLQRNNT